MISSFGAVSILIFLASVGVMILHFKVMRRRGAADEALAALDDLLRERLETLFETAAPEIREKCQALAALETRELFDAIQKIENTPQETEKAIAAYNEKISEYNAYIEKFPARAMAVVLGMKKEITLQE